MHDHLQRAALGVDDAEGVLAEEVGGVGHGLGLVLVVVAAEHGREDVLDEAHAVQLADLAVEELFGGGVLVRLDPALAFAQIVGDAGVDHGVVAAVDAGDAVFLEDGDGLVDHRGGEHAHHRAGGLHLGAARGGGGDSAGSEGDVVAVEHVGAQQQGVADELLLGLGGGGAHLLGRAEDHVVVSAQLELIGDGGVGAVLIDRAGHGGDAELLPGGDHALGELGGALEGVPLAPLDLTLVVGGQGLALGKLCVEELGARVFEQLGVIESLELRAQGVVVVKRGGRAGTGVDKIGGTVNKRPGIGKVLQIHVHRSSPFQFSVFIFPRLPHRGSCREATERAIPTVAKRHHNSSFFSFHSSVFSSPYGYSFSPLAPASKIRFLTRSCSSRERLR